MGTWEQWEETSSYLQSSVSAAISRDVLMKIHTQALINSGLLPAPSRRRGPRREGGGNEPHLAVKRLANNRNPGLNR
jgi:hypothetical protein